MIPLTLRHVLMTVHLVAAALWLGLTVAFSVMVVPVIRDLPEDRAKASFERIGRQARRWVVVLVVVVVLTGLGNLHVRGLLSDPDLWRGAYGLTLAVKLLLAVGLFVLFPVLMVWFRGFEDQSLEARIRRVDRLHWAVSGITVLIMLLGVTLGGG